MTKEIRDRLRAAPFIPFVVRTADGREYPVPTPDHAHVYPSGGRVTIFMDDDGFLVVPALIISGIGVRADGPRDRQPAGGGGADRQ